MPNNLKAASDQIKKKYFGRHGVHMVGQFPPKNLVVVYVDDTASEQALRDLRAAMEDDAAEFRVDVEVRRAVGMKPL
jgi:hypothetical protein